MNVFELGDVAETKLQLQYWVRDKDFKPSADEHPASKKYQVERRENGWENATLWRVGKDGVRAQNPIILSPRPSHAQISHLGGPLTFALRSSEPQPLERSAGDQVFEVQIGTPGLAAPTAATPCFHPSQPAKCRPTSTRLLSSSSRTNLEKRRSASKSNCTNAAAATTSTASCASPPTPP